MSSALFLNPKIWWLLWLALVLITVIFSLIFIYHWRIYGLRRRPGYLAEIIFLAGAGLLLLAAAGAITALSL